MLCPLLLVIRGGIKRNAGADVRYRDGEAERMAARRRARPKERALDAGPCSAGPCHVRPGPVSCPPRQISGRELPIASMRFLAVALTSTTGCYAAG